MEYIKPSAWLTRREDAKRQLKDALGHGNGYVFGDLRKPNALFTEDGGLNFDWAGCTSEADKRFCRSGSRVLSGWLVMQCQLDQRNP